MRPFLPTLRILTRPAILLGLTAWLLLISGCETPEGGTSLPWNRPASWERQMPGMGMGPAYGR